MLTVEEIQVTNRILQSVVDGFLEVEAHPEMSTHQQATAAGGSITSLISRYGVTKEVIEALMDRVKEQAEDAPVEKEKNNGNVQPNN